MLWSGSKPLTVVRANMWGFLMFAGVAWLAISWCVMRLEPSDVAAVAGPVVLFGALTEAVRALSPTRTWWLNAGLAVLFAVTGVLLWASADSSSYTTPAALLGWYLMVRGAADIAVAMMTRETDRIWGLLMVVGVLEAGLGFFAASPLSRSADLVVTVLGGLGLARGVSDLVAGLRLREAAGPRTDVLELSPERAAGVAGYSAGLSDYEAAPVRPGPRHRASSNRIPSSNRTGSASSAGGLSDVPAAGGSALQGVDDGGRVGEGRRAASEIEAVGAGTDRAISPTAAGGVMGAPGAAGAGAAGAGMAGAGAAGAAGAGTGGAVALGAVGPAGAGMGVVGAQDAAGAVATTAGTAGAGTGGAGTAGAGTAGAGALGAAGAGTAGVSGATGAGTSVGDGSSSFHDEVVRTTADLDAMLALAGVTGAGVMAGLPAFYDDLPEIPDTPEGALESAEPVGEDSSISASRRGGND